MDIYPDILTLLKQFPLIQKWPEMEYILNRFIVRQPGDWKLPASACQAVGASWTKALPAMASIACMQISIYLIDDLLDEDPRGYHHEMGVAAVANLAAAFQSLGAEVVAQSQASPSIRLAVLDALHQMVSATALGQYWDSQNPSDEAAYWKMVHSKSGFYYGTAFHIGALLGEADPSLAHQIKEIGCLYGEMCQIHDDLNDSLDVPANPDWTQGRYPLPILFATIVDHPERERFLKLRQLIPQPEALTEAQNILLRSGAISYGMDQLLRRYKKACHHLAAIPLAHRTELEELLEEQIKPVWSLAHSMGFDSQDWRD